MSAPAPRPGQGAERAAEAILGLAAEELLSRLGVKEAIMREAVAPMAEEVARLRKALEPFARLADEVDHIKSVSHAPFDIRIADLRAARSALSRPATKESR